MAPPPAEYVGTARRFNTGHHSVEVIVKKLLGALAVAGMAVAFSPSSADAATCWWNGYTWVCKTRPYAGHWRHHRWGYDRPYAWYR